MMTTENCEFSWGKKRGVGGKKKEVQFYESFTYDDEEYSLYDNVYLYKEGDPEPYIGKLVKIWEQPEQKKKVKVLWFFRPVEILNFLGDDMALMNELFLASGEGVGVANVNPLEAIAGKCNVVCTSKDSRNPQPSEETVRMADYVFSRTFDVGTCTISDRIDDTIAATEVRFLFNGEGVQKTSDASKLDTFGNIANGNVVSSTVVAQLSSDDLPSHSLVKEDFKISLVKHDRTPGGNLVSDVVMETVKTQSSCIEEQLVSVDEKTLRRPTADKDEGKADRISTRKAEEKDRLKSPKDLGLSDDRPTKKARIDNSVKQPKEAVVPLAGNKDKNENMARMKFNVDSDGKDVKASAKTANASEDTIKSKLVKDSVKKAKPEEKTPKSLNGTVTKAVAAPEKSLDTTGEVKEVTKRPDADRRSWFKALPWEERMKSEHEQGKLVLLENLDPTYTSEDIEDIIWSMFRESCTAKMVASTAISSPHSGQAFVIFKTRDAADLAVRKLEEGCLLLPNGRPLVASWGSPPPKPVGKSSSFVGHLVIDKAKHMQREEWRRAVSTSHCSQPNTVEYDMAMEWCLLRKRADDWWAELYKQHGNEFKKLKATSTSK